jgi:fructan beta-fructosidase
MKACIFCLPFIVLLAACGPAVNKSTAPQELYNEPHRPKIHFSPQTAWMNDPNGMVYHKGTYHLFYQFYPDSTVWGPMHWGHATSTDLVHWQQQPVALYPDSLGYIFSGSAVVDVANTSGFGTVDNPPLVAIFTHHDPKGEKAGRSDFETQSLAYSLDDGKTWTKYRGNPVVKNPGIRDFRDPKVMWHEETKKWIMTLATLDRITFYSSPNLMDWTRESEFGKEVGAHGGVWECPDLFPLDYNGQTVWVLIVNLNPGGPNGGSATQYFTGTFDGHTFTPFQTDTRWLDYGPDEYAGITWSNTGQRKIFLGWMSNWQYANRVPTEKWRSALTVPRDLSLQKVGEKYLLVSRPVPELDTLASSPITFEDIEAAQPNDTKDLLALNGPFRVRLTADTIRDFSITVSNLLGEQVVIGYAGQQNAFYIDRTQSGKINFEKGFAARHTAPRLLGTHNLDLTLIIDNASVELFADGGLTVMTSIFFPNKPFNGLRLQAPGRFTIASLEYSNLKAVFGSQPFATKK